MTTDFRAMCAELVDAILTPNPYNWEDSLHDSANRARALLAQPVAEGPTDEELLAMRSWSSHGHTFDSDLVDYARAVLTRFGRPTPQPVAVSERLPEPSVKVLAHYFNALGKGRTICAIWVPAQSRSDEGDLDSNDFLEYDEENDKYHWPEGWYEAIENWDDIGWAMVYEGEVAYWQPLPKWPANALPTPDTNV